MVKNNKEQVTHWNTNPQSGQYHAHSHITRGVSAKGRLHRAFSSILPDGYAMLLRRNKVETPVHGCLCLGDMVVRTR